jgi:hypothetical protein
MIGQEKKRSNMSKKQSHINLIDLPDEILVKIFNTLNNVDVLYSLMGINTQLDKILNDSIFTNCLTLMECRLYDRFYSLPDSVLTRFCSEIIPQIFFRIKWLNIESTSMDRVLFAANYPNLSGLGLYNVTEETIIRVFHGKIFNFKN